MKKPRVVIILENFNGKKRTTIVGTPNDFTIQKPAVSTWFDGQMAVNRPHGNPIVSLIVNARKITEK